VQEGNDLLDRVNKVKAFPNQVICLNVPVRHEDIVMTLLKSLSASYEYLITTLETMPIKDVTMDYVTAHLMHKILMHNEKEPQGGDVAMVFRQSKGDNSFPC
jgi:hypothetical protein